MVLVQLVRLARRLRTRRGIGFGVVAVLMLVAMVGNAVTYYLFDRQVDPGITWGDAAWYSIISITTIGYGDFSAVSPGARIGTVVFIVIFGLTSFSAFFGMLIDWATVVMSRAQKGLGKAMAKEHVLIVNFPAKGRVLQLIDELRSDPEHGNAEICIISDQIEELPFAIDDVVFVRGSPHDKDTYDRARVTEAKLAIVLSMDYSDPNSDAVVAAAVSVIDAIKPEIHIVAECLDDKHRPLFAAVRCDAIVSGLQIAGNLLVQEVHDPGVCQAIAVRTSNRLGSTLFSTEVTSASKSKYAAIAKSLMDHDYNVIAVNRGEESHTDFASISPKKGDHVIYVAAERRPWPDLLDKAGVS